MSLNGSLEGTCQGHKSLPRPLACRLAVATYEYVHGPEPHQAVLASHLVHPERTRKEPWNQQPTLKVSCGGRKNPPTIHSVQTTQHQEPENRASSIDTSSKSNRFRLIYRNSYGRALVLDSFGHPLGSANLRETKTFGWCSPSTPAALLPSDIAPSAGVLSPRRRKHTTD